MTRFNIDGYEDAVLGHRVHTGGIGTASALQLYASGGLFARAVDKPADDVTAKGVEVEGDDGTIANEIDRLKLLTSVADAVRWARLTGGAGLVLICDDGRMLPDELNTDALRRIEEIKVFDLTDITAGEAKYNDPTKRNYGMPIWYRVNTGGTTQFRVHESRLIEIPGAPMPRQIASATTSVPWAGRNAVDRTYKAIMDYTQGVVLTRNILERKQQPVYGMKGLAEAINANLESSVQKRIQLVDAARGVLNTVAVDAEDSFDIQDMTLSGIKDVIGELKSRVSAESGIPITLLFGESPGGLNSTGQHDMESYYDMIRAIQRVQVQPAVERIISLIFAQSSVSFNLEHWCVIWPALTEPSEKEKAEIRKTAAEAEKSELMALGEAITMGIISEDEARKYLVSKGAYEIATGTHGAATDYAANT